MVWGVRFSGPPLSFGDRSLALLPSVLELVCWRRGRYEVAELVKREDPGEREYFVNAR